MKKISSMLLSAVCLSGILPAQANASGTAAAPQTAAARPSAAKAIHDLLDQWHRDAASADRAYFDKMTENAVFIGTDPDERWTRAEFIKWSEPFFQRGKAWTFHVRQRHLKPDLSGKWAWFDEQLDTDLGLCQASGVVVLTAQGWKIDHYQLSISVKNELIEPLKKLTAELPAAKKTP